MKIRYMIAVGVFLLIIFGVSVFTVFDTDAVFSQRENRELSKMPEINLNSCLGASFMKSFEKYYDDTFPVRDTLIDATRTIDSYLYLNFLIGSDDVIMLPSAQEGSSDSNDLSGIMMYQNHIMEVFTMSEANTQRFADIVNKLTVESGLEDVYVMVPPPAYALYAPDNAAEGYLNATQKLKNELDTAKFIDLYDTFSAHKNEPIVFRTDHHWTGRGAYYAANEFVKVAENEALPPLESYKRGVKSGFLGSLYKSTMTSRESLIFKENPDDVEYFFPMHNTKTYNYLNADMDSPEKRQILYPDYDKDTNYYCIFMGGDYQLGYVESDVKNGKSIMVVRDSYGHAFIPMLADEYQYIYFVEPRYFSDENNIFPLADFIKEKKIEKMLFLDYANAAFGNYWMTISANMEWMSTEK